MRRVGALAAAVALATTSSWTQAAEPERRAIPQVPLGFSKLVVRLEGSDEIGVARGDFAVQLLEHMRARGFQAVGAENLVFGKDESRRAEYVVGGTVREVDCSEKRDTLSCRIGVEWQLLDVARDEVVYAVMSRAAIVYASVDGKDRMAAHLVEAAMDALLRRDRFRKALAQHDAVEDDAASSFEPATIAKCAPGRRVADSADSLLAEVVVVKGHTGFGSGFFVSPEGLVLTAAHVLTEGHPTIRLRDGVEIEAVPVRVAPRVDVALLRPSARLSAAHCAAIRPDTPPSGTEVYAVGAPASMDLAFSLTRGIVSGFPVFEGRRRVQTDASISPGNSGGPLVDANGSVVGIVSAKISGGRVEGLAFAVPIDDALSALGLSVAETTDRRLLEETASLASAPKTALFTDRADPIPSLDPDEDARRDAMEVAMQAREENEKASEERRARRTPGYVPALEWGGLGVALAGLATAGISYLAYEPDTSNESQFDTLRAWNTAGWIAAGIGAGSFALSFALRPSGKRAASAPSVLRMTAGGVKWCAAF